MKKLTRRRTLAILGSSVIAGCTGTGDEEVAGDGGDGDIITSTSPASETSDMSDSAETRTHTTSQSTSLNEAWPMARYDAGNTGFQSESTGPGGSTGSIGLIWEYDAGNEDFQALTVGYDSVFVRTETSIRRIDKHSGEEIWVAGGYLNAEPGARYPTLGGEKIFCQMGGNSLQAVHLNDPQNRPWRVQNAGGGISTAFKFFDDTAFISTWNGVIKGFDAQTGEQVFTYTDPPAGEAVQSWPGFDNSRIFCFTFSHLVAIDRNSGETLWVREAGNAGPNNIGPVPVVSDNRVIANLEGGKVVSFNADDGNIEWEFPLSTRFADTVPPAVADGTVFVNAYNGPLYAIDLENGQEIWSRDHMNNANPVLDESRLYLGNRAVRRQDGETVWEYPIGVSPWDSAVSDGMLFTSLGNRVVALAAGENQPPNAEFIVTPVSGELRVLLDASMSSDPDGEITQFEWDFTSDGTFEGTGIETEHRYDTPGSYDITLRVTDSSGAKATSRKTVDVEN